MSHRYVRLAQLGVILLVASSTVATAAPSKAVDPANFTAKVDNPWFPLIPGTSFTYTGTKDEKRAVEVFQVTSKTKTIAGVTCVVVDDTVSLAGVPAERTLGYYAQDRDGTVWYFGEDNQELDAKGRAIATEGWRAGVNGALPSLFMEATPTVGKSFAHKYTKSNFEVVSLAELVKVPYGAFKDALMTKEWSPSEPDVLTHKYYVRGVGTVRDVAAKGPKEELVLVKVEHQ